jgi:transposase
LKSQWFYGIIKTNKNKNEVLEMQRYDKGEGREQVKVVSLEELIDQDNPVRVIDAFVDSRDMIKLGFKYAETKETGRKPKDPSDMCKLYIYCYYNGIRSSRKIERECTKNIEIMWLTDNIKPHNKTISDFRKDNKEVVERLLTEFNMICDMLGLIGKEMSAVDGSKFRASNSRRRNLTKNKVKKMIKHHEESVREYLELLEENDKEIKEQTLKTKTKEELQEKLNEAQKRIGELLETAEEIEKNGNISLTDKDSKHMSVSNNGTDISHNVQVAVDSKHHLVVAVDVTSSPVDHGQLYNMSALAAKEFGIELKEIKEETEEFQDVINVEETKSENEIKKDNKVKDNEKANSEYLMTVLADKGYYQYEDLKKCLEAGILPIVPKQKNSTKTGNENYIIDNFIYDINNDTYICPENQILINVSRKDSKEYSYKNKIACMQCPQKDQCTTNANGRIIKRSEKNDVYEKVNEIMDKNKEVYKLRQQIVEHPFGTIKRALGYTYFLTRGNKSVRAESVMHFLVYNLKRVINIKGVRFLVAFLNSLTLHLFLIFGKTSLKLA